MVHTQGKQDKKVTTLLTREMVEAIDALNATRTDCGVKDTNKFVFANQLDGHLSTWQSLHDQALRAGCKKPDLINCNSLRKYIATVCQVYCLCFFTLSCMMSSCVCYSSFVIIVIYN